VSVGARALLARGVARALRAGGRGATSLPGKLLLALEPHAIGRLAGELPQGSVVVSATNGKTTTTALAAAILGAAGTSTVHNVAGANMAGGVASALLERRRGAELGLFEVDEFWLDRVSAELRPRAIVLGNLFRDQLDRYGELETIGERWAALLQASPARLVANADDPLIADLGRERAGTLYFGIEDAAAATGSPLAHASDSTRCRNCGAAYLYEHVYVAHLGAYACPECGRSRPQPEVSAHDVRLDGLRGLYNVYNALAAAALATALGLAPELIATALAGAAAVFGRGERVQVDGRELSILLVKNPAGANEVLRLLGAQAGEHDVLGVLNDRIADGRDVSWIWDADFETLAPRVRHATCSGTRAAELALRLKYAGVPLDRITVTPALDEALDGALARAQGELYALPTYTAMLALRELLRGRGQVASSWARA
jgi:UDP-N-acetylmuramyl tripeptide synthase